MVFYFVLVCFKKKDRKLKKGDMVFFQRSNGQYVMHRICKVKQGKYYFVLLPPKTYQHKQKDN